MIRIISKNAEYSREEVANEVRRLATAIKRQKQAGNLIALLVDNSVDAVLLLLAAMTLGRRIAICPAREPHAVLLDWLKKLNANILFSSCGELSGATIPQLSVNDLRTLKLRSVQSSNTIDDGFSTIMRTSGTTGVPKNALITAFAHRSSACAVNEYFSFDSEKTWALSLPLYHVSGFSIVMRSVVARASIFLAPNQETLTEGLLNNTITHLSLVPTQLKRLLDDQINLHKLEKIILGGDAVAEKLRIRALEKNLPLFETYGLTETASMIWVRNTLTQTACVLPHARLWQRNDREILVGGQSLFAGYLDNNELIQHTEDWFATGDIGIVTENDQLQLISRKSHRIIAGGENVQAEEIERVLEQHPAIEECVVVGLPDDDLGMRPIAYIKWLDTPIDHAVLSRFVRDHLSAIHVPKYFFAWPSDLSSTLKKPRALLANRSINFS